MIIPRNLLLIATLSLLTLPAVAQKESLTATASFGTVYGNTTVSACFNNPGDQYTPTSGSVNIQTAGGGINVPLKPINPQNNCLEATLAQGNVSGSLTGSGVATLKDDNGNVLTLTIDTTGQSNVAIAQAAPKYEILSILYDPPGDKSSTGFSNGISAGATTTIGSNFSTEDSLTFSNGIFGEDNSITFTVGAATGNSSSYTVTYQATSGSQLDSVKQAIDHTQDQVYLWINPTVTVRQTGAETGTYSLGTFDSSGNFNSGAPMDIVNVNIEGLENPSEIPLLLLLPQTPKPGVTLPGLANICANPLPPSECTQQNACGCVAADFATIVAQDPLANITNQTIPSSSTARGQYIDYITLEGPEQSGSGPVVNTFQLSDSEVTGTTESQSESYGVAYSYGWEISSGFTLGISSKTSYTYMMTQSYGQTNGVSHTAMVTMGSDKVGCYEDVDIYEDTIYHTFAFSLPQQPPAACQ